MQLGFNCEIYTKRPRARVYVFGKMIDEFFIEESKFGTKDFNTKAYLVHDDPSLRQSELRIVISNNDNDSNNGFMSKMTYISCEMFRFFPFNKKTGSGQLIDNGMKKIHEARKKWLKPNSTLVAAQELDPDFIHTEGFDVNFNNPRCLHKPLAGGGIFTVQIKRKYGIWMPSYIEPARHFQYNRFPKTQDNIREFVDC